MAQPKAEFIALQRSKIARLAAKKYHAVILAQVAHKDRPYTYPVRWDDDGNEIWRIEKQFWLKHKSLFQDVGFVPLQSWNKTKKMHQMLEKF